jgi:hypothetical protein
MLKRVVPMLLLAWPALADIPPPPGAQERWHSELIRTAGFECNEQPDFGPTTPAQQASYRSRGLDVRLVECRWGRRYLVGTPPRRYGAPQPNQPPPPAPVVEKLD